MSVPSEPGLYWARIDNKWTVVEFDNSKHGSISHPAPAGSTWVDSIGWDAGSLVADDCWGPRLTPPSDSGHAMPVIEIARETVAMANHARQERGGEDSDIERLAREVLRLQADVASSHEATISELKIGLIQALGLIGLVPAWHEDGAEETIDRLRKLVASR